MKQNSLDNKYQLRHTDGTPVNPEDLLIVLNASSDKAARIALRVYADLIREDHPAFADELRRALDDCAVKYAVRQIKSAGRLLRYVTGG